MTDEVKSYVGKYIGAELGKSGEKNGKTWEQSKDSYFAQNIKKYIESKR